MQLQLQFRHRTSAFESRIGQSREEDCRQLCDEDADEDADKDDDEHADK